MAGARGVRPIAFLLAAALAGCGVKGQPISPSEAAAEAAEEVRPQAEERLPTAP